MYIRNCIIRALSEGHSNEDALDSFLMMKMENSIENSKRKILLCPSLSEVYKHMIGNQTIQESDYELKSSNAMIMPHQRLIVKLSPSCTLYIEKSGGQFQVTINEKSFTSIFIRNYRADDMAMWIISQKEKLDQYIKDWEILLHECSKKMKGNRMALLAIKAIFSNAMKDYPHLKYNFIEQKRRVRIMVRIPNTNLGIYIDGWWGSYKERLPEQIDNLKLLIDAHSKSTIKTFFTSKY